MKTYQSKAALLPGTSYNEVLPLARREYGKIENLTKRQPYVRSAYFSKNKIFVYLFWPHVLQKNIEKRTKRLRLFNAAIDLLRKSRCEPYTIIRHGNYLHRFSGVTKDGKEFYVQVKQDKKTGRLDFISVFPKKDA